MARSTYNLSIFSPVDTYSISLAGCWRDLARITFRPTRPANNAILAPHTKEGFIRHYFAICHRFDPDAEESNAWCFLENVRDPGDPRSGCFTDVKWSSKDGRFWSGLACKGLEPYDAGLGAEAANELPVRKVRLVNNWI